MIKANDIEMVEVRWMAESQIGIISAFIPFWTM